MRSAKDFVPGRAYFIVMFADEELRVPVVQTLIFEKPGKRDNGSQFLLFRQIRPQEADSKFVVEERDIEKLLLEDDELVEKLKRCFEGTLSAGPSKPRQ